VTQYSRRSFLGTAAAVASVGLRSRGARADETPVRIAPLLLDRAHQALQRHADRRPHGDVMGIADFSLPSSARRFHLLNLKDGSVSSYLVAHGRGSDPAHTGWLQHFSNELHSNATSQGAYLTGSAYVGAHGRSIRLTGLDASDSNAEPRAIVVHAAWYVNAEMARERGIIGRSDGCFALAQSNLDEVLRALGPGRLIYADKIQSSQAGQ
jgi:hypothetical protein